MRDSGAGPTGEARSCLGSDTGTSPLSSLFVLLILYASLVPGSDAAGRVYESAAVTMLWMVVALPFFAVNAVLLGTAFVKERPAIKPLIASLLSAWSAVVLLID